LQPYYFNFKILLEALDLKLIKLSLQKAAFEDLLLLQKEY
jgi:hypothetical protein